MKLGKWGRVGLPLFFIAGGASGAAVVAACSSDSTPVTPIVDSGAGNGDASTLACVVPAAGTFPVGTCDTADNKSCPATPAAGCAINQATCGDPSTCMPMSSNSGKSQLDFRMRRINVQSPSTLAAAFVQAAVVTKNVDLPATQGCGDSGFGAFNWLIRVDKTANTLTTGGAPPSSDPFNVGYCFYNDVPPSSTTLVSPVTVALVKGSDGSYGGAAAPLLNIPIFLNGQSDNVVILPISDATFHSFTTSNDDNCVGSFNRNALDSTCTDDSTSCEKWKTSGSLGGYITIAAADTVNVADLNESLCVLITGTTKDPTTNKCKTVDGKIPNTGDYCSVTKSAGGCADSYWMSATFAAAAIKIDESGSVAACKAFDAGAPPVVDSGTDTGTTTDAGADAGADTGSAAQDAASE